MHLLLDELTALSRTPYFNKSLQQYLDNLIRAVRHVVSRFDNFPSDVTDQIAETVWLAAKYLQGGTSKAVPYETVYALRLALLDWVDQPCAITTALRDDLDYHFWSIDPGKVLEKFVSGVAFDSELIQIALPKLYRHFPLYNVALYHELGHFVDSKCGVISFSLIWRPPRQQAGIAESHRKEHFSDLFAACYTGNAISLFLDSMASGAPISATHPATAARISVIEDFLSGAPNPIVDFYQDVLSKRGLPELKRRYVSPSIKPSFDAIRTYPIANNEELHGLIDSGWIYLCEAYEQKSEPWRAMSKQEIMRIINDLIEKSIRNRMVKLKWSDAINHGTSA